MTNDENEGESTLAGAYALDAVSADEAAAYEAHLERSQDARNEHTELQDTAVLLGLAVPPVQPSDLLKQRLMATIAGTPQLPADVRPTAPTPRTPAEAKARNRWARPLATLASVAAAVALVVGGLAIGTGQLNPAPDYQSSQLAEITAAADVRELTTQPQPGVSVTLRWSPELASSALIVDGMDPAPAGSVYQLWYIGETGPRAAGFLRVTAGDEAWSVLEGDMGAGDVVGVTLEPAGGSDQPTTDPLMVVDPA